MPLVVVYGLWMCVCRCVLLFFFVDWCLLSLFGVWFSVLCCSLFVVLVLVVCCLFLVACWQMYVVCCLLVFVLLCWLPAAFGMFFVVW